MFGLFRKSDKAIDIADKVVDGAVNGLDALFFTDEEKATVSLDTMKLHLELIKQTADENSLRSISRRGVAWMIVGTFLGLAVFAALIWKVDPAWADHVLEVLALLSFGFGAVVVFYFGYYGVKQIVGAKK